MFNANNILEALKNYIRARGGQSAANNIAEAVNDLNSIPQGSSGISEAPVDGKQYARKDAEWSEVQSGEDIPDEVTNAIETNGMGWTSEEEVPAINITWDGDTEGRETYEDEYMYKVSDLFIDGDTLGDSVVVKYMANGQEYVATIEEILKVPDVKIWAMYLSAEHIPEEYVLEIYLVGQNFSDANISIGVYFGKTYPSSNIYVSALEIPASTEEVVHQIDSKYISGLPFKITLTPTGIEGEFWTCSVDKTVEEISQAILDGRIIIASSVNIQGFTFCRIASAGLVDDGSIYFEFINSGTEELPSGGDMYLEYDSESSEWTAKIAQPL